MWHISMVDFSCRHYSLLILVWGGHSNCTLTNTHIRKDHGGKKKTNVSPIAFLWVHLVTGWRQHFQTSLRLWQLFTALLSLNHYKLLKNLSKHVSSFCLSDVKRTHSGQNPLLSSNGLLLKTLATLWEASSKHLFRNNFKDVLYRYSFVNG